MGTRKSARNVVVSDSSSDESETPSSRENEEEEEENSPTQWREERRGRPPQRGRPRGLGKGRPLRRTTPPTLKRAKRSGQIGPNVRRNHKFGYQSNSLCSFVAQLSLMSNVIMQSAPDRIQRIVERLPGLIGRELSSARCLPLHCRRRQSGVATSSRAGGGGPGGAARQPPGLQE